MQNDSRTDSGPRGYAGGKWKQQASSAAEDAKMALGAASGTVKDRARQVAEQQKKVGAEQLGGVARAVYGAAHELERELPHAAGFILDAAARLESAQREDVELGLYRPGQALDVRVPLMVLRSRCLRKLGTYPTWRR